MLYQVVDIGKFVEEHAGEMIEAGGYVEVMVNRDGRPTGWRKVEALTVEDAPTAHLSRATPPPVPIKFPRVCMACDRREPHEKCAVRYGQAVASVTEALSTVLTDLWDTVVVVEEQYNEWLKNVL